MKLSNYKEVSVVRRGKYEGGNITTGEVDVTTGILRKRTKRVKVARTQFNPYWYFKDTEEFTPGKQMENLARDYYG